MNSHTQNVLWCDKHNFQYLPGQQCEGCNFNEQEAPLVNDPIFPDKKPAKNQSKAGKLRWSLLPVDALEQVVKVLEMGAVKHSPNGWREENWDYLSFADALERHFRDWQRNKDIDDESKLLQMAHTACNALFLVEMQLKQIGNDDRFKYRGNK